MPIVVTIVSKTTPEARARTRAFASVIGPFLVIVPAIIVVRAPNIGTTLTAFFKNEALVWITGGFLVLIGLWLTFVGWIAKPPATS